MAEKVPKEPYYYSGCFPPRYTSVPDDVFDELLPHLSGAEVKVVLYIIRRTFGFKKDSDDISLSQICKGITKRDGDVLDSGTGLSSSTAQLAIKGLVEKGVIVAQKNTSPERGNEPTTYALRMRGPSTENRQSPPPKTDIGLYRKSPTQETVLQENNTEIETDRSKLWDDVKAALKNRISGPIYHAGIEGTEAISAGPSGLTVRCTPGQLAVIRKQLAGRIKETIYEVAEREIKVKYVT